MCSIWHCTGSARAPRLQQTCIAQHSPASRYFCCSSMHQSGMVHVCQAFGLGMSNFQLSLLSTFAMTMLASPLLKARLHGHRGRRGSHVPRSATFAQRSANLGRLTGKPGASFQVGTCLLPPVPSPPRYETRSAPSPGRGEASGPLGATPPTHLAPTASRILFHHYILYLDYERRLQTAGAQPVGRRPRARPGQQRARART